MNKETFQLIQSTLEAFKSNQTKSLAIFERYMSDQSQQSQQLLNILSQHVGGESVVNSTKGIELQVSSNGSNGMDMSLQQMQTLLLMVPMGKWPL